MIGLRARREQRAVADQRAVLAAIRTGVAYGLDINRRLHLSPTRMYLALARLERAGLIVGEFQESGRRAYRATGAS